MMNAVLLCLGMGFLLAILFGLIALIRYLNYRETLALAEQGLTPPERKPDRTLFRWGIVLTFLGLALTLGLYFAGFATYDNYPFHLGPWMLGGLIPLFLGLALVLIHYLTEKG
jgi:phosphoglycerol transferase MdoB-like AlkP superfamily enzyme